MKLIGHKKELDLLTRALEKNHLPHTLLFSGSQGIGKRIVALSLAERILGADRDSKVNTLFWNGTHPDLHLIGLEEDKKDISVGQAREFITSLQLRPYLGATRVAIIDDAHLLSLAASNALLLTLEEPPNDCFIILVTHAPQRILPTILSRSQEIGFSALTNKEVKEVLTQLGSPSELTEVLLELSDSSMEIFDLKSIRDGYFCSDQRKVIKHLQKSAQVIKKLVTIIDQALESKNTSSLLSLASELGEKEYSTEMVFRLVVNNLRGKVRSLDVQRQDCEALDQLIQLERSLHSRNLNPVLQLSNLLIQNFA